CEGGHADFAPRNELEIALLEYLVKQFGHVSAERVASGMGIENIYKFLRETGRGTELPAVAEAMKTDNAGVVISRFADSGKCPMCAKTIDIFVSCLGAEASNMALKTMATGGVFLGGGIPVKLLSHIQSVAFLHAFNDKGRLTSLMENTPVLVILNDQAALLGAAYSALEKSTGR
ncbi:MAG: glucokinase, partial [Spartobacteria bacterium]